MTPSLDDVTARLVPLDADVTRVSSIVVTIRRLSISSQFRELRGNIGCSSYRLIRKLIVDFLSS